MKREFARAKVNLTLHVGRVITDANRFHGYHPLDSLVVFADIGDGLNFAQGNGEAGLTLTGPFATPLPEGAENLVVRARNAAVRLGASPGWDIALDKHLPVAAGLGGGSADAAAVLRALVSDHPRLMETALSLGADVPACVLSQTLRMTGIGEWVSPLPGLGQIDAVLANPGVAVSTAAIFRALDTSSPKETPRPQLTSGTLLERARDGRNDLEPVACALEPKIAELREAMAATEGCRLARMTGSGATVFGLYASPAQAARAAASLAERGVWARACRLGD